MQRIGLFGGSFDPVHLGHLLFAQAALEELRLDRVFFIPASQSPFKPAASPAPAAVRVRLLRLALAGLPRFEIDDQEVRRGGVSYTIDTVRKYAQRFDSAQLWYLIGGDHVRLLPQWRESSELAQRLEFVMLPRPGELPTGLPAGFRVQVLSGFPLGVSSSQIRARVRTGLPINLLVPPAVAEAIADNQLYL
jgi:nicotinate-nucleotide adenylyltransferase